MPTYEARLAHLSKHELITLVRRMVERHEDLKALVERAAVGPGASVDTERITRRVRQAFGDGGYVWGASFALAIDLEQVAETGDELAAQGAWEDAAAVYRTILEEVMARYETIHEDEGEVAGFAEACAAKLAACLPELGEAAMRDSISTATPPTWSRSFGNG